MRDLGKPDGLIAISARRVVWDGLWPSLIHPLLAQWALNHRINVLPILMTAINAVSSAVYLKGFTIREKAQTYALAVIFLILLYNSPSGLVLYWTLNNLFSLGKNVVQRWVKKPWRVAHGCVAIVMIAASAYPLLFKSAGQRSALKWGIMLLASIVFAVAPYVVRLLRRYAPRNDQSGEIASQVAQASKIAMTDTLLFLTSAVALALLCGLVLPASTIATSPTEFSFVGDVDSPFYYIVRSLCVFMGLFVLWPAVIYKMFSGKAQRVMPYLFVFALVMALLDVYVTGFKYGALDQFLLLNDKNVLRNHSAFYMLLPLAAAAASGGVLLLVSSSKQRNWAKYVAVFMLAICIAECALGTVKSRYINRAYTLEKNARHQADYPETASDIKPVYHLSKTGKNVIVLFLDCTISSSLPYFIKEKPSLNESMSGFVYYPNTVSFSSYTVKSTGAMMGGYEYTPQAMNDRPDELILDKQAEAAAVLPRIFIDAGWQALVTDPPCVTGGHGSLQDALSPYNVPSFEMTSRYRKVYLSEHPEIQYDRVNTDMAKHLAMFCVMQSVLPIFRQTVYNNNRTLCYLTSSIEHTIALDPYSQMYYLPNVTDLSSDKNTFTFIDTFLSHEPELKALPDYTLSEDIEVDKTSTGVYKGRVKPRSIRNYWSDVTHYHGNMSAVLLSARWFDYLKELGVYDNTRIVIVSDHCRGVPVPAFEGWENETDLAYLNPLLMVKDFGATGIIRTDNTFMTNADALFLAKQGLPVSDTNPFTLKSLSAQVDKSEVHIYPLDDFPRCIPDIPNRCLWRLSNLRPVPAYSVHDNIFDKKNWRKLDDDAGAVKEGK